MVPCFSDYAVWSDYKLNKLKSGPGQSMKIDDRKINRSIDDNRFITVD